MKIRLCIEGIETVKDFISRAIHSIVTSVRREKRVLHENR